MAKFEIYSFDINSKTVVEAQGIAEAMFDYLPWNTLNVTIEWIPSSGVYNVIDNQTDFKYKVKPE